MRQVLKERKLRALFHGSRSEGGRVARARHQLDLEASIRRTGAWVETHFSTPTTPPVPTIEGDYIQRREDFIKRHNLTRRRRVRPPSIPAEEDHDVLVLMEEVHIDEL